MLTMCVQNRHARCGLRDVGGWRRGGWSGVDVGGVVAGGQASTRAVVESRGRVRLVHAFIASVSARHEFRANTWLARDVVGPRPACTCPYDVAGDSRRGW